MDPGIISLVNDDEDDDSKIENIFLFTDKEFNLFLHKLEFIMLVFSTTCYFYFVIRSISRIRSTGDLKFLFLLTAAFFALMNNSSDIYYRIMTPLYGAYNCNKFFLTFFKISASLNWVPISYYQVLRLYYITYNYYRKIVRNMIIIVSSSFSLIYSVCYFLNLKEFYGNKDSFGGCVVSNTNKYGNYIEVSDIIDSCFSLTIVISTLFQSIKNLKQYKLRHHKIKAILDESIGVFVVLLISKVVFYSLIMINSGRPGGDIFWDGLSVIVLFCTYRLLNITPKLNEKLENKPINEKFNKRFYKELSKLNNNNRNNYNESSSTSNIKGLYNRNSKGELNFPSLMKTNGRYNIKDSNNPYGYNGINNNAEIFNNLRKNKYYNNMNNSNFNETSANTTSNIKIYMN